MSNSELNIPESWARTTLDIICKKLTDGTHYTPTLGTEGYHFVTVKHVESGKIDFTDTKFISKKDYENLKGNCNPKKGDVLFSKDGTVGKVCLVDFDKEFIVLSSLAILRPYPNAIKSDFLRDYLLSNIALDQAIGRKTGSAIKRIILKNLKQISFPMPPIKEQVRIVNKIETYFSKIEKIEKALHESNLLLLKYRESLLAKAFRGELVPQDSNDEPARELLKKIKAKQEKNNSKKKKRNELVPISEDEVPFEIPSSWEWIRLNDYIDIESGNTPKGLPSASDGNDLIFIKVGDMNNSKDGKIIDEVELSFSQKTVNQFKIKTLPEGTIIFPKRGGAILTNKKRLIETPFAADTNIMGLLIPEEIREYIWNWFQTITLGNLHTGSTIPQINNGDIAPLLIPIPPLNEQQRIIEKLIKCDLQISSSIDEKINLCRLLKEAILNKAFQGQLVPQISEEGTGHELLEQILKEKEHADVNKKSKTKVSKKKATKKTRK
ncbi:restriction endonuclease subunit S [Halobacteriovorax sp. ZH1_bin.1]|uniref:restriction endonuclease subunit S n=1 Tax=Halobacteriovorax sp. ZH1_bin.1 TaxID=3157723 RepID=UPI003720313F